MRSPHLAHSLYICVLVIFVGVLIYPSCGLSNSSCPSEFAHFKKSFLNAPEQHMRAESLLNMFASDRVRAFPFLLKAFENDSLAVQVTAARLISSYYVKVPYYEGQEADTASGKWPSSIASHSDKAVGLLLRYRYSESIELKLSCLQSLCIMGKADTATVDEMYSVAAGQNSHSWVIDTFLLSKDANARDMYIDAQKRNALLILRWLAERGVLRDYIRLRLQMLYDSLPSQSPSETKEYRDMIRAIIGCSYRKDDTLFFSTLGFEDDYWIPADADAYCDKWVNSSNPAFNVYPDADCANFGSQCLIAGGLSSISTAAGHDNKGCIPGCDELNAYLSSNPLVTKSALITDIMEMTNPHSAIPSNFNVGDIAILGNESDAFKHTVICSKVIEGNDGIEYYFSAHSNLT